MGHFYRFTGDRAFLTESWPSSRHGCGSRPQYARGFLHDLGKGGDAELRGAIRH
jgi:hypothetical protein